MPPMTAGCSINTCNSALYVLLSSPYYACFEPIKKRSAQPHLSGWGWAELMGICGRVRPYFFGVKMVISPVECFLQVSLCLEASRV